MILINQLRDLFPDHELSHTYNDAGYSDVELLIDDNYTSIWVDDYDLYLTENDDDYQISLDRIKVQIEQYLYSNAKSDGAVTAMDPQKIQ